MVNLLLLVSCSSDHTSKHSYMFFPLLAKYRRDHLNFLFVAISASDRMHCSKVIYKFDSALSTFKKCRYSSSLLQRSTIQLFEPSRNTETCIIYAL
jgi:hypothetical protein